MVEELRAREKDLTARCDAKRAEEGRQDLTGALNRERSNLEELQRKIQQLRQVGLSPPWGQ